MEGVRVQAFRRVRIEHDQIGVEPRREVALAGIEPEEPGGRRRDEVDPSRRVEPALDDALVGERDPRLDAGEPAGSGAEPGSQGGLEIAYEASPGKAERVGSQRFSIEGNPERRVNGLGKGFGLGDSVGIHNQLPRGGARRRRCRGALCPRGHEGARYRK